MHSLADQLEGHPYLSERALCAAWGENTSHLGGCDRGWMTVNCHLAEAGLRAFRQRVQLEQGHAGWEEAHRVRSATDNATVYLMDDNSVYMFRIMAKGGLLPPKNRHVTCFHISWSLM